MNVVETPSVLQRLDRAERQLDALMELFNQVAERGDDIIREWSALMEAQERLIRHAIERVGEVRDGTPDPQRDTGNQ